MSETDNPENMEPRGLVILDENDTCITNDTSSFFKLYHGGRSENFARDIDNTNVNRDMIIRMHHKPLIKDIIVRIIYYQQKYIPVLVQMVLDQLLLL